MFHRSCFRRSCFHWVPQDNRSRGTATVAVSQTTGVENLRKPKIAKLPLELSDTS